MPVLAATLALWLSAAPVPVVACPAPIGLGPADAPVQLTAYLDLTAPGSLGLWLELRRLVSDMQGHLHVRLAPATGVSRDPANERLLRWLVAIADRGSQESALRLLDRDGRDRLALRLARADGPAALMAAISPLHGPSGLSSHGPSGLSSHGPSSLSSPSPSGLSSPSPSGPSSPSPASPSSHGPASPSSPSPASPSSPSPASPSSSTPAPAPDARAEACAAARIDTARRDLRVQVQRAGGYLGRPPLFVVGPGDRVAFEDTGGLEKVRGEVTRELQRLRAGRPATRTTWPPARPGVSARLVRPPADAGMLVGGVGLPHRLVLFIEHDEHPNLGNLIPVLEWRRAHPGQLAIQIVARGTTSAARQLRSRLCAAQHLGLELEYLRRLTRDPLTRAVPEPIPLVDRLDEAAEAHDCELGEPELEPGPGGVQSLPDGAWLDGTAVGQGDLEAIGTRILGLEAAQRPLDAVFSAAAPAEL